ncbi:hypothetical protein BTUL_0011g00370 [Botrytis tulipae]|uniref:Uncharacterized protein n=1 Tax=Botrytis tulipae TaxID=87230 RepID=A0A4Z1F9X5_9HELO|nr:hypothetical protein BTUL_0011g00370 [Botrytis tulipae]
MPQQMCSNSWSPRADTLFVWVAGGVWLHEKQIREGKHMISRTHLFDAVGDFLDALNKSEPFDMQRVEFKPVLIRSHVLRKKLQWEKLKWVERPSWLSKDALKGQFGEVGLEALHESTSRLRRATGSDTDKWRKRVQKRGRILQGQEILAANNREFLRQEKKVARRQEKAPRKRFREEEEEETAVQRQEEAQMERFRREEEEKRREQQPRREVERLGYTKDTEYSGGLSWTDPNASGSHYPGPEFNSHGGALRYGAKNVYFTTSRFPSIDTTSTAHGQVQETNASSESHLSRYSRNSSPRLTPTSSSSPRYTTKYFRY